MRKFHLFLCTLCLVLFTNFKPDPIVRKLTRKWELVGVKTASMQIQESELRAKSANTTMEFFENGNCIVRPAKSEAMIKKNKWTLLKNENTISIVIEADNGFGEPFKQTMLIEEISAKKLVLSVGKDKDKEIYTYKAIK